MKTAVERLAEVIGYPDTISDGVLSFAFMVDGAEIVTRETGGRLLLERRLWQTTDGGDETFARIPATLAWDPNRAAAVLWQDIPASTSAERRFFEVFTTSCDWWNERVKDALTPVPVFPEMVIMP